MGPRLTGKGRFGAGLLGQHSGKAAGRAACNDGQAGAQHIVQRQQPQQQHEQQREQDAAQQGDPVQETGVQQRTDVAVCQQHTYDHERQRGGAAAHRTAELLHRCGQPPAGGQQHQHSHRGNVGGGDEGLEPDLLAGAEQAHHIGKEPYIIRGHGHACKHSAARGAQQGAAQRQADEAAVGHSRRAHQHRILARRVVVQPAAQPAQAGGHHKQCQQ